MMKTTFFAANLLLFLTSALPAQNLTGTWEGAGGGSGYCKMVILHIGDSLFGYTYDTGMGYCKANFSGIYDDATKKLVAKNIDFIERKGPHSLSIYHLNYSASGTTAFLNGRISAKTVGAKLLSFGLPFPISYRKLSDDVDTTKLIAAKAAAYNNATPVAMVDSSLAIKTPVIL